MGKKSPETEPKPQHDEYVEMFMALTNGMLQGDMTRESCFNQCDTIFDNHNEHYPEIVIGYQLGRLATEVEAITT